ncbi:hemagglutinin, partial [Fusobacterium equinum]
EGDNAKLTVKLAKELKDLTSVETKDEEGNKTVQNSKGTTITDKDGNKTEITKDGMTITPKNLETGKTAVSLTKDGLNNGGNKITHVADGTADTDAVNKSQLDKAKAAATTKVKGSENIEVDGTPEKDGSMTYTVKTKDKMTLGKDSDKKIVADGETGKLTVGKEVEMDGTTGNARFGKVKVNGEKGTVGGLTNKTWDKDNIVSGQAATEDQLQVLDKKMQNNTEELINKGMDFSGNDYDAKNAKTKIHKKLGDRLEIIGGLEAGAEADSKNLRTRVTDDGKLELLMAKNPKFKSVEAGEGDTKVTIGDIGIKIGDKTYITKDGINANGNKITNVAEGTADTDAVNKSQLDKAQAAATTKVEGSENIQVDKTPEKDGSMTYTVKTKDKMTLGKDSDKKIVADGETGKLTVGKEVEMDGTTGNARFGTVKVNGEKGTVGGLTNKTWDKDNIVSGQAATEDQLKAVDDKVDNLGNKIDETTNKVEKGLNFAADTGKATNRQLGDTLTIAGDNNNITTSVEEGKVKVALKEDVKVKTLTSKTVTTDKLILKGKDGKTTDVGETLDKHDKDIQENKNAIKKGLNFAANHGEVNKQLGDTMSIKGKDGLSEKEIEEKYDVENIVTSVDKEGNLWIKMAKNPKFKSVEAGEGDTKVTIGDIGIKIGDKTYITKDGINANDNKIKNVADGKVAKGSKDAINGGQLHDALSNVQEGMNQINHRVDKLDDRMHRGLANAAAMSTVEFLEIGINQATVGAAIGTYRGNQAVAVGVQAAPTENMRVHAKVSVAPSRNNTETMAGVGASWRFNIK